MGYFPQGEIVGYIAYQALNGGKPVRSKREMRKKLRSQGSGQGRLHSCLALCATGTRNGGQQPPSQQSAFRAESQRRFLCRLLPQTPLQLLLSLCSHGRSRTEVFDLFGEVRGAVNKGPAVNRASSRGAPTGSRARFFFLYLECIIHT